MWIVIFFINTLFTVIYECFYLYACYKVKRYKRYRARKEYGYYTEPDKKVLEYVYNDYTGVFFE